MECHTSCLAFSGTGGRLQCRKYADASSEIGRLWSYEWTGKEWSREGNELMKGTEARIGKIIELEI